jgi:uncharacterized damage-inducible protein DinB
MEGYYPMNKHVLRHEIQSTKAFQDHVSSIFTEEDATFAPFPGTFTVAQQIAHAGVSIDWLIDGAKSPEGFSMDFEAQTQAMKQIETLAAAKDAFAASIERALEWLDGVSDEELTSPLPQGFVMPGEPRVKVVWGIVEHTAHHRGSLVVYARALGRVAPMAYEAQVPWQQ